MKAFRQILDAASRGKNQTWALATLVRTEGSTYRRPGARLLVRDGGESIGVLSGGCLEEEIARRGLEVIQDGLARLIDFDTRKLYGCDGKLGIFIERIPPGENFLTDLAARIANREICRSRTDFSGPSGRSELLPGNALVVESPDVFVQNIDLPLRLLLIGGGPEIAPLRSFASGLGWEVLEYFHPDELPENFRNDPQTAAVVMTHNFGRDLASLDRLLPLGFSYFGLLGPKRRQASLLARFQEFRDLDPAWLDGFHSPAGLDIGSESPEEIALSIISEVSAVLAKREGGFLRNRRTAIHTEEVFEKEA